MHEEFSPWPKYFNTPTDAESLLQQVEPSSQLVFIDQHNFLLMPTRHGGTACFRSL